jgi:hypothetical protein
LDARRPTSVLVQAGAPPERPLEVLEVRTSIPVRAVAVALATLAFAMLALVARADAFV